MVNCKGCVKMKTERANVQKRLVIQSRRKNLITKA